MPEIEAGCAEQAIAEYLLEHPEYFDRRPEVLLALELGHSPGGGATSLVQRQVARLRRGNGELEARLEELSGVARHNRELADRIHRLTLQLLARGSVAERIERLRVCLRRDFSVDNAALVLFCPVPGVEENERFVKVMRRGDPRLKAFDGWLDPSRPRCGPLPRRHRALVFGETGSVHESAATVPLGEEARLGFLILASGDPERFNRGQHVDFLRLLGDVVTAASAGCAAGGLAGARRRAENR